MRTGSMWCAVVALAFVTAVTGCGSDGTGASGGGDASTDGGGTGTDASTDGGDTGTDASTDGGGTGTDASTDGGGTGTDASTDGGDAGPCEEFTVYADEDDDGYGNPDRPMSVCEVPEGYVRDATDCDDDRNTVHPGADEYCNDVDDDCDGETDEAGAMDLRTFYRDADGDGYGDAADTVEDCAPPEGYVPDYTDCNDDPMAGGATVNPGADEACNGIDDDCDGSTDEDFPDLETDCTVGTGACAAPGRTVCATDGSGTTCEGTPGTPSRERCNGIDDDCDGETDEDFTDLGTRCTVGTGACEASGTMVCTADARGTECSATEGSPGTEVCNGIDDDCDGATDEADATDATVYYADCDRDGYAAPRAFSLRACTAPTEPPGACRDGGWTTRQPSNRSNADCYDANPDANPAATMFSTSDRGDGSFDYDCNGLEERRWPEALCEALYATEAECDASGYVAPRGSTCGSAIAQPGTCRWDSMTGICATQRAPSGTTVVQECR